MIKFSLVLHLKCSIFSKQKKIHLRFKRPKSFATLDCKKAENNRFSMKFAYFERGMQFIRKTSHLMGDNSDIVTCIKDCAMCEVQTHNLRVDRLMKL